jgi:glucarate dehydratase
MNKSLVERTRLAGQICEALGVDVGMRSCAEFGISQVVMLHLAATLPNLVHALDSHYHHLTDDIIEGGRLKYCGGRMAVPKGPGLGLKLDRDKLAKYRGLSKKQQMASWIEDPKRPGMVMYQPKW